MKRREKVLKSNGYTDKSRAAEVFFFLFSFFPFYLFKVMCKKKTKLQLVKKDAAVDRGY